MSITISDLIYDEEFRTPSTGDPDNDVASLSAGVQAAISALSLTFASGHTGFPQFAEKADFVSSDQQVTDYFLTSSSDGDPFPAGGVETTLQVGSDTVFLFATTDPNIVIGRIGTGGTADPSGDVALIIVLDETKVDGLVTEANLWVAVYAPLVQDGTDLVDSGDTLDLTDLVYLGSTFNTSTEVPFSDFEGVAPGNNLFNVIFPTDNPADLQLLLTGSEAEELGTVNVSTKGIGANSQHVDTDASLRVDFVKGMTQSEVNDAPEVNQASHIDYTQRVDAIAGSFEITQVNPGSPNTRVSLSLTAFQVTGNAQEQAYLTDAIATDGAAVTIDAADVKIFLGTTDVTATFGGTITQNGAGVLITGLDDDHQVKFTTDNVLFDRFIVTNTSGTNKTFDVGNILVTTLVGGSGTEFEELGSHLIFEDDGPLIAPSGTTAPELTVADSLLGNAGKDTDSFAGLFTAPDFGADGAGDPAITYDVGTEIGADSGLIDTATGNSVFLFLEDNADTAYVGDHKVVGREGTDATDAETGEVVFFISPDPITGNVTLQQERAVFHAKNTNDTSVSFASADLVTLIATAYDSEDPNADTDSATVEIGLSFNITDDVPAITPQPAGSLTPNDLVVGNTIGASDSSSYTLDPGNDLPFTFNILGPDTTGDFTFAYFDVDGDNVTGNNEIKGFYKGDPLYTLIVNDDGTYTVTMIGELPSSTLNLNTSEIKAGGPDTNFIDVGALETTDFVRISGDSTAGAGNINESHAFVGVDNGNLDVGESLFFTLHEADEDPIFFEGIVIGTKSAQASQYHWEAALVGGGTASANVTVPKNGVITIDPAGDVLIESVTITKLTGSATKIGLGDIDILLPPRDAVLDFDLRLTDDDEDFADTSFSVSIDGNGDGLITDPISASSSLASLDLFGL